MPEPFSVLVMAAGRGTRMRSALPKVLHPVCGKPMVEWVVDAARAAGAREVVCVTRPGSGVADGLPAGVEVAEQAEGEGTGAAVLAARESLPPTGTVAVLSGDHPLVSAQLIEGLVERHKAARAAATVLTTDGLDPTGYGRIVRDAEGSLERIVETKRPEEATPEELAIREVNIGTYAFELDDLWPALESVGEGAGERYLTGVFPALRAAGREVVPHRTGDLRSSMGVNDRGDLMEIERVAARAILGEHAARGVTFLGPDSTRVDCGVEIGEDTVVWPSTTLRGATVIGARCELGPCTTITDSRLEGDNRVPHAFLVEAHLERGAAAGPFAYLRPGAHLGEGAKVGTFVEVKNSELGAGAKVPHLSYIGDADVGEGANVAAGNITANYDGFEKHRTRIGAGARTGVNASFVAPVSVGEGAYIGAGSVIDEDVPDGALGISRPEQKNVEGYAERIEKERG
jgi:bifunctional UDP-N-acetylglucosamine pyrophosphorylase / glucosamine-1-phosphate N-acetyltransferase